MIFQNLSNYMNKISIDSKLDANGYLSTELKANEERHVAVIPPKNKNDEEAMARYEAYKNELKDYKKNLEKTYQKILAPEEKQLHTEAFIKSAVKNANNLSIEENKVSDNITLSSKEKEERKEIQKEAKDILCDQYALFQVASQMLLDHFGQLDRQSYMFFASDAHNMDDLFRDFDTLINGTDKEKTAMMSRKYNHIRNSIDELTEQKTPKEMVSFFKENWLASFTINELQGENYSKIAEDFNITPKNEEVEYLRKAGTNNVGIGTLSNRLEVYANPYYPRIKENAYRGYNLLIDNYNDIDEDYVDLVNSEGPANLQVAIENEKPLFNFFADYASAHQFGREEHTFIYDYVNNYFAKNKDIFTKIVDEKGNEFTGNREEIVNKLTQDLPNGKTYLLYDKFGNLKTMVNIPNYRIDDVPKYSNEQFNNVDLRYDSTRLNALMNIKKQLKEMNLDSVFSSNHQEFTDLKNFVNNMESIYKKGTSCHDICNELKELATRYIESKYINCKYDKTDRTYRREEFCFKIINAVERAYPTQYEKPKPIPRKRIADDADLKKDAYLNKIIELNKEGAMNVDEIADEMLDDTNKIQIEVHLDENKNEPIVPMENNQDEPILNNDEPVHGMGEK